MKSPWVNYPSSGFFVCYGLSLLNLRGFNPFIVSYGWDDIDLYRRMEIFGCEFIDAPPGILHSIQHCVGDSLREQFSDDLRLKMDSNSERFGEWDLLEVSNWFNKSIAELTLDCRFEEGFDGLSWESKLGLVGKVLLEKGIDFECVYRDEFVGSVWPKSYKKFVRSSLYAQALRMYCGRH